MQQINQQTKKTQQSRMACVTTDFRLVDKFCRCLKCYCRLSPLLKGTEGTASSSRSHTLQDSLQLVMEVGFHSHPAQKQGKGSHVPLLWLPPGLRQGGGCRGQRLQL